MSAAALRGAVVGAGFFARHHLDAWRRLPGVAIVAVADLDAARAEALARQWHVPRWYANVEELLARERLDFLDVITRPEMHLSLTLLAAVHRVHVICQKPLAPTLADCRVMVTACEDFGVRLLAHENWRWQPWYRATKSLLDAGRVGDVVQLRFTMRTGDGRGPEPYPDQPYFRAMPHLLLYETGVHFLDTFRYLAGDLRSVVCRTRRLNPVIQGEDAAWVHVEFASGAAGVFDGNRLTGPVPADPTFGVLEVEGTTGAIRLAPNGGLFIRGYGEDEQPYAYERPDAGYRGDSVRAAQEHYLRCLRDGLPCETEGRDYLHVVAAVEACYRAAETGQVQVIDP